MTFGALRLHVASYVEGAGFGLGCASSLAARLVFLLSAFQHLYLGCLRLWPQEGGVASPSAPGLCMYGSGGQRAARLGTRMESCSGALAQVLRQHADNGFG